MIMMISSSTHLRASQISSSAASKFMMGSRSFGCSVASLLTPVDMGEAGE